MWGMPARQLNSWHREHRSPECGYRTGGRALFRRTPTPHGRQPDPGRCMRTSSHIVDPGRRPQRPQGCEVQSKTRLIGLPIERAGHPAPAFVQYMGINHRRRHILVAQQFLHRADIVPTCQQMRGKRMTKRMRRCGFDDSRIAHRLADGALDRLVLHVMPAHHTRTRINRPVL